tara:strand:+ start:554 stop:1582 length:1029 start_codon:yes stop_codon:yes gene_type:complete
MAISTSAYSPKEFQVLIAEQDAFGTIEASGGNPYHALDVDSIGSPSLNPVQVLEPRAGGRVLMKTDFFQDVKASVKEISVSGTATTAALDMLLENIMGEAEGAASGVYSFLSDRAVQQIGTGDGSLVGTALSVVIKSGFTTNADLSFKDCVVTSLTLNGDAGTEGGRVKFSATFQTGSVVEDLTDAVTTVDTTFTSASENYLMSSWTDPDYRKVVGVDSLLLSSFSLNLENPATFHGVTTNGYELCARAGEFSATMDMTVKYDDKTEDMFEVFNNQSTGASKGITLLNNDASLTDANFGINMPSSVLTNVSFNEGDIMMLDLSVKALGEAVGSSTALVEVAC